VKFGLVPFLMWVFFGSAVLGAFYDFSVLLFLVRSKESSIFKIAENYLGRFARYVLFPLFLLNIFFLSVIILEFFAGVVDGDGFLISALLASQVFVLLLGLISRFVYISQGIMFLLSLLVGAFSVFIAYKFPINIKFGELTWNFILILYALILAFLPVSLNFQPKGYLNSALFLLIFVLLFSGFFSSGHKITFDSSSLFVKENLFFFPLLLIGVSCGALSGFHSIFSFVSAKQISSECHISKVGFGSSILEGLFLSVFSLFILKMIPESLDKSFVSELSKNFSFIFPLSDKLFLFAVLNFLLSSFESMVRSLKFISEDFFGYDSQPARFDFRVPLSLLLFLLISVIFSLWWQDIEYAWYFAGLSGLTISLGFLIMLFQWFLREFRNVFLLLFTFSAILFLLFISSWGAIVLGAKYFYGYGISFLVIPSFVAIFLIYSVSKFFLGLVYERFRKSD
jgi:carbon starvation protein CstA